MASMNELSRLELALAEVRRHKADAGDGKWFEDLVRECAPLILEWDISEAWTWADWPDRTTVWPGKSGKRPRNRYCRPHQVR